MRTAEQSAAELRPYFRTAEAEMLRILINSVSWTEAHLALELLKDHVPEKTLVHAANMREAIKELPRCPIAMAVEFDTLSRVWRLRREGTAWVRDFEDPAGDYKLILLGEGNYCYDVIVRTATRSLMWAPKVYEHDLLNPDFIDLIMKRRTLLTTVIDLVRAMGLPFSPLFYFALEDWREEHSSMIFDEIDAFFRSPDTADDSSPRVRGHAIDLHQIALGVDDSGITWLR